MGWLKNEKDKFDDMMFDHPKARKYLDWAIKVIVTLISCFIFAWGFRAFINPTVECAAHWVAENNGLNLSSAREVVNSVGVVHLTSGGASGTSQAIVKIINIFVDIRNYDSTIISILYFVINVPLMILGWFKISKEFTIFTLLNVACVSLFNQIIPDSWVYNVINIYDDMIARCIFGGITTGISSGLAMIIGTSAGGTDVLSFFLSEKKSTGAGQFSLIINGVIILSNVLFAVIGHTVNPSFNPQASDEVIKLALYTLIYLFTSSKVLDILNTKNKKQELQIFTSDESLPEVLVHSFPHSATVVDAKGAFTGKHRLMVYMVVSKKETKQAIAIIRKADPTAFITLISLNQVYGRFYMRPIE